MIRKQNIKYNINKDQRNALKDLIDDDEIIIRPADKGGGTVIMDKNYYETEITNLLTDKDFYKQLDGDPYQKLKKDYGKLITSDENGLTNDEIVYLMNFE